MDDEDSLFEILDFQMLPPTVPEQLRSHLRKRFPLRGKDEDPPGPDRSFKVDDRKTGEQVGWQVSVTVPDGKGGLLELYMTGVPTSPALEALVSKLGGTVTPADGALRSMSLPLRPKYPPPIRKLVRAVRAVQPEPRLRWLPGRAAKCLDALAAHLSEFKPLAPPGTGAGTGAPKPRPTPPANPKPTPAAKKPQD